VSTEVAATPVELPVAVETPAVVEEASAAAAEEVAPAAEEVVAPAQDATAPVEHKAKRTPFSDLKNKIFPPKVSPLSCVSVS
jgi:hypothetical protein